MLGVMSHYFQELDRLQHSSDHTLTTD